MCSIAASLRSIARASAREMASVAASGTFETRPERISMLWPTPVVKIADATSSPEAMASSEALSTIEA